MKGIQGSGTSLVEGYPEKKHPLKTKQWFNEITSSNNDKCIHCGCGLGEHSMKLRCTSCACPIGKWQPVTSVEQQQEIEKIIDNES